MISLEINLDHHHGMESALLSPFSRVHDLTIRKNSINSKKIEQLARREGIRPRREKDNGRHPDMQMRISWDVFEKWQEYRNAQAEPEIELVLFLDHLHDPQNVGNIIRTARFFGASVIVIPKQRSVKMGETLIRTSTGAALSVPMIYCSNLVRAMQSFQDEGGYIWGLDANAPDVLAEQAPVNKKLGLVVGSEGDGMKVLTQKNCDQLIRLSQTGHHESLNAASASAIAIYACMHKLTSF